MLPEGKAEVIAELKQQGYKVLMLGDGMNDSPTLSEADVGVANGQLADLLHARKLAQLAMQRIKNHFRASVGLNTLFLTGGLSGTLTPGLSALLHNAPPPGLLSPACGHCCRNPTQ